MPDEWQIEAVKEQFKVLHSLETLQTDLDTSDVRAVTNEVDKIVRTHLRVTDKKSCKPSRNICAEIMKVTDGRVNFGFIVIVSDQRICGMLSKIPIFVLQFESSTVFIDTSCFSFKSWDSFLQHSGKCLPPGKFCFPVNGHYLDGRRLMIGFETNQKYPTRLIGGGNRQRLVEVRIELPEFAASFFLNIKPAVHIVTKLMPLAQKYWDVFKVLFKNIFMALLERFSDWKKGKVSWEILAHSIFELLCKMHKEYKELIDYMTEDIECAFGNIWDYLNNKFSSFFKDKSFPFKLLALASTNDEPLLRNGDVGNLLRQTNAGASQISGKCVNESAFHHQLRKEKSQDELQDLTPYNKALVDMTYDFITYPDQQDLAQNELSYIYLSLKELVLHESNKRLKLYYKHREAACKFSDIIINIDEYNKCLGITGDPETHCFMEAVGHINQSPIIKSLVNNKSKQLIEQEPVHFIQCLAMPSNQKCGLYKCIGMRRGLIPAQQFVNSLKQIVCSDEDDDLFDEYNLVEKEEVKELSSEIVLMTNKLCIFIWQGLNKERYAEGYLSILEDY